MQTLFSLLLMIGFSTLALGLSADERWSRGEMPCDVDGAKNEMRLAMDLHYGSSECLSDAAKERNDSLASKIYEVLEVTPRGWKTGSIFLVGAETEALVRITVSLIMSSMLRLLEVDPNAVPVDEKPILMPTLWRNLAALAFSPSYREIMGGVENFPEYLQTIANDTDLAKLSETIESGSTENAVWSEFSKRMKKLDPSDEMFAAFRKMFLDAVKSYSRKLLDSELGSKVGVTLTQAELKQLYVYAETEWFDGDAETLELETLKEMLRRHRDKTIERSIADLFCKTLHQEKPIVARFGISHVPDLFTSLENRLEKTSAGASRYLKLDARALKYPSVKKFYEKSKEDLKRYESYVSFAERVKGDK